MPARPPSISAIVAALRDGTAQAEELNAWRRDVRAGVQAAVQRYDAKQRAQRQEEARLDGMLSYERPLWSRGLTHVAGVDEVGAGPLAGPVCAAAVILPPGTNIAGINDSKLLSASERADLAQTIRTVAIAWGMGSCSPAEIDTLNILQAAREAMRRAVGDLSVVPQHVLVDARVIPRIAPPQTAIIKGDSRSQSIAAAAILAKVERDALMERLAVEYPGYGFEQHRGYGTAMHLESLRRLGPSPIHRHSFAPVAQHALTMGARE